MINKYGPHDGYEEEAEYESEMMEYWEEECRREAEEEAYWAERDARAEYEDGGPPFIGND